MPAATHFLSRDPPASLTRKPYQYVSGNPFNAIDPTGLDDAPTPMPSWEAPDNPMEQQRLQKDEQLNNCQFLQSLLLPTGGDHPYESPDKKVGCGVHLGSWASAPLCSLHPRRAAPALHLYWRSEMEDIVAVRLNLDNGDARYFLTWGRLPEAVDPAPLERLVLNAATRFSLGGTPVSAQLCATLQEAASEPYFFENFFKMCQRRIPFGPEYKAWAAETLQRLEAGKELYYLGRKASPQPHGHDAARGGGGPGGPGTPRRQTPLR